MTRTPPDANVTPVLLFTVTDTFLIRGHDLILAPGISSNHDNVRVGDPLRLKRPDGSILESAIGSIEMLTPNPMRVFPIAVRNLSKDDVPIGTEVWTQ